MSLSTMDLPDIPENYAFIIDEDGNYITQDDQFLIIIIKDKSQMWYKGTIQTTDGLHPTDQVESTSSSMNESSSNKSTYQWSNQETNLFIDLIDKNFCKLEDPKLKKKLIFQTISANMSSLSKHIYSPTAAQCENRYKSLLKKYKDIRDYNNTSGNDRKTWELYEKKDNLFGRKANVSPTAHCSSIELANAYNDNQDNAAAATSTAAAALREKLDTHTKKRKHTADDEIESKKSKKKLSKVRSELVDLQKSIADKQTVLHNQRMTLLREQHNELKSMLQQLMEKIG